MGSKLTNAQVATPSEMSGGIASAFGDGPEAEARKRKEAEDAAAQAQAQEANGQSNASVWGSMGMDALNGLKAGASDAWSAITAKKK